MRARPRKADISRPSPNVRFCEQLRQQQQYAQHPQQQQQQLDPLASYLISIPGLTIPKFQFLYHYFAQRPDLLTNEHWSVLRGAHGIALDRGVKEDSPEYFGFLHSLLNQQTTPRRRLMQRQHRRPLHQCRRRQNLCRSMWRMSIWNTSNTTNPMGLAT